MLFVDRKIFKTLFLITFLYSCNIEGIENQNNKQINTFKEQDTNKYTINGNVKLNDFNKNSDKNFNTKALDIAISATVSVIYPSDYSNIQLREATIATGLTDSNGVFSINVNFTPELNQVMILESSKRSKGVGYPSLSLRTHIMWNGTSWQSISTNEIRVDKRTTAISLISALEPSKLSSSNSINKLTYNGETATVSYDTTFTQDIYKKYYSKVFLDLENSFDPVKLSSDSDSLYRAQLSSVKSNVHTVQTMIETYAVDWGGVYPESVKLLEQEAKEKTYWKNYKNPFNPLTTNTYLINDSDYQTAKITLNYKGQNIEDTFFFRGAVTYNPIVENGTITKYFIYGLDSMGEYITDRNNYFTLTNG